MIEEKKDYWYYTNDTYELKTKTNFMGEVHRIQRNISGPIPPNELYPIVRGINPSSARWQKEMVTRLQRKHFNVYNILEELPEEVGLTLKGRARSFFFTLRHEDCVEMRRRVRVAASLYCTYYTSCFFSDNPIFIFTSKTV